MSKKFRLDRDARRRIDNEFPEGVAEDYSNYDEYDEEQEQKSDRRRRRTARFVIKLTALCLVLLTVMTCVLLYTGYIWFNEPRKRDYPYRGPIIDADMGKIGWQAFSQQNIQFAYITATKGKGYVDERFEYNKKNGEPTDLPLGYLHIFEPKQNGRAQAEHFISTVGNKMTGRLIPAAEIEYSGVDRIINPDVENSVENLKEFVAEIESQYGVKPMLLCREKEYRQLILPYDEFEGCPIWIDSIFTEPDKDIDWTLWTYTPRAKYRYYDGDKYVDVAVLNGAESDFKKLLVPKSVQ
ncbi:MAG: hypothetical protein IJ571_04970 [Ruminococcus sp.]|nr:hypothetical protein [Ruminococcus sp.]